MLPRLISRRLCFRRLTLALGSSNPNPSSSSRSFSPLHRLSDLPNPGLTRHLVGSSRTFSSSGEGSENGGSWKFTPDTEDNIESVFGSVEGSISGISGKGEAVSAVDPELTDRDPWSKKESEEKERDIFEDIDRELKSKERGSDDVWETAEGYEPWRFEDQDGGVLHSAAEEGVEKEKSKEEMLLEKEEQELSATLKGPNRAFGDLIAASGITEEMLDSLILLKNLEGVEGLPPLREIEDIRLAKDDAPSSRFEMERKKQEEVAKSRVRQVDEKGRAYGTGRRKCSVARVWIQPGDGKFIVNDKEFDIYFPILDDRAELLRPFTLTKTLGLWDVKCTVKGGGVSGQVGAIRLGISRALQNWEPGLRPDLRHEGYLTRDPRVVERKKPGKAKARKSFQWVKR